MIGLGSENEHRIMQRIIRGRQCSKPSKLTMEGADFTRFFVCDTKLLTEQGRKAYRSPFFTLAPWVVPQKTGNAYNIKMERYIPTWH
jgi:hypothetical protein